MYSANQERGHLLPIICLAVLWAFLWPIAIQAAGPIRWAQTGGPLGGMVHALAIHPDNPDLIFMGAQNGLYKSLDGGAHWVRLSGGSLDCQEITELAIAPLDARVIYAGGSEGLFRSVDGGESWVQLGSGLTSDLVLSLAVHPLQSEVLYLGSENAVFKSADHGDHWEYSGQGLPETSVWSLAIDPSNPQTLFAGTDQGLYRSDDGGASWRPVGHDFLKEQRVQTIALDPHLTRRIWVGTPQGLFRSDDGGTSWVIVQQFGEHPSVSEIVLHPLEQNAIYCNAGLHWVFKSTDGGTNWMRLNPAWSAQGLVLAIAVHPTDSRRLYVGTAEGLYRSSDGGDTWTASNEGFIASDVRMVLDVPGNRDQLYAATRWGVYETTDGGQTWEARNHGLPNLDLVWLALDPIDPKHLFAATWEGEICHSSDGGRSWALAHSPLAAGVQVTGILVGWRQTALEVPTILYMSTDGAGVWRSLDFGVSWEHLALGLPGSRVSAIWLSPKEEQFIYVGVGREVYRLPVNADPAETLVWKRVTTQPLNGHVTSGLVEPKHHDILVATDAGSIYRVEPNGTWTNLARDSLPSNLLIEALAIATPKGRAPLFYAVTSGGLFTSNDNGHTWSFSSLGCPQRATIRSLAVDDRQFEYLYVGTDKGGVYRGRDMSARMASWVNYGLAFIGICAFLVAGEAGRRYLAKYQIARQGKVIEQNWASWDQAITHALDVHNRVTPDMLSIIPAQMRIAAMRRYIEAHRDQDLLFQEDTQAIVPANHLKLQHFAESWASLVERLDSPKRAAPIATHITEQLCDLLGFSPLESRTFKSVFGHMVKAPAVRLSIPPRFPLVFMLGRELQEEDVKNTRDLMSVLNVTSFFALLIAIDENPSRRERARELKRLVRGSSDDFIVLDYHDLRSLFLARDAERRLVDLILAQADLTVVSPYIISGPVPENMFFGRDYELKAIMRTIRDRSFAIVGGRKIGKTSILNKVQRLIEQTSGFIPFHLDCQHVISHEDFFGALAVTCQVEINSSSPEVLRRVILRLRRQRKESMVVLLLDEVDPLLAYDMQHQMQLFRVFRAVSQEGLCRFVFCGERRLNNALHDPSSPLFNFANTLRLSYLTEQNARRLIQEPMAIMGITFEDANALVQGVIELSSCHPNIIQAICQMLLVRANGRGDRVIRMDDLAQVRASDEFRDFFFEVTWGNATPLERLISVLMVEKAPTFTAADVKQALAAHGCNVTGAAIEAALDGLVLFSILKKQGSLYAFESRSFPTVMAESQLAQTLIEGLLEALRTEEHQDLTRGEAHQRS